MDEGICLLLLTKVIYQAKRASAREFLVEALKKDETDVGTAAFGKTNLNDTLYLQKM